MKNKLLILSNLTLAAFTAHAMQDSLYLNNFPEKDSLIEEIRKEQPSLSTRNAVQRLIIIHGKIARKESKFFQRILLYKNPTCLNGRPLLTWSFAGYMDAQVSE